MSAAHLQPAGFWPVGPTRGAGGGTSERLDQVLRGLREMGGRLLSAGPAAIGAEQQWWQLESRLILVVVYDRAGESFEVFTSCGRDDVGQIKAALEACFAEDDASAQADRTNVSPPPAAPKRSRARNPAPFADASST